MVPGVPHHLQGAGSAAGKDDCTLGYVGRTYGGKTFYKDTFIFSTALKPIIIHVLKSVMAAWVQYPDTADTCMVYWV